ncbi:MAG: rhomboid family intramembrane serine protease [Burkholderiales bacterium]|nr:rhomboid family intramembrane serine protease [Burkholderiales bacterium]
MLILPLPPKPDWRRPPVVTLLIIVVCTLVYMWQDGDDARIAEAVRFYANSSLPELEIPAFMEQMKQQGRGADAARLMDDYKKGQQAQLLIAMDHDKPFMDQLHANRIVTPNMFVFDHWRQDRLLFDRLLARAATPRYALDPSNPSLKSVLASIFMHGSWDHLIGNMVVLFIVGYAVEGSVGGLWFLMFFLLGGLGASVADLIRAQPGISLGASGAISAVMASYVMLFGLRRVRFFYFLVVFFNTARWPAIAVLPVWLGNELFQYLMRGPDEHVNFMVHFCGFIAGAFLAACYSLRYGDKAIAVVNEADKAADAHKLREAADALFEAGKYERAAQQYAKVMLLLPGDADAAVAQFRAAKLAPAALADAVPQILGLAVRMTRLPSDVVVDALREAARRQLPVPRFKSADFAILARHALDANQLDMAEKLVLKLGREGAVMGPPLLFRLARAYRAANEPERAKRVERMLLTLHSHSDEARQLQL